MSRFVYIVDDEEDVRLSVRALLSTLSNVHILLFASGNAFLGSVEDQEPGVVLLDNHMPGQSGIEVLQKLSGNGSLHEVIMITGQGDIALAVEAMKRGACDFLEKPYDHFRLFEALTSAFERLENGAAARTRRADARAMLGRLSSRERQVLDLIMQGQPNKVVAAQLGISVRTIEVHRANILEKLAVRSLAEAIHLLFAASE